MSKFNDIMKEIGQALVSKKFWVELLIMTFGMFMTGVCVYYFLVPSKLIVGSISGLSIVLTNIFNGMGISISLSMMISIINAILLILAYLLVGKEFGLKTVYCAMILGPMTKFCEWLYPWQNFATPNDYLVNMGVAPDQAFSVMGNHDFPLYMKGDPIMKSDTLCVRENVDEELGWRLLVNDRQFIKRGEEKIYISGMDNDGDGVRFPQNGDIQHALYGLTPKHFVVMLEHDPSAWRRKILPHSHVQLTLSGHTHGGQFSFLGWSPASLKYKEYSGLYSLAGRYLYVSNGLSGVVPFRFGTLPEISVFTLRTSKSSVNK